MMTHSVREDLERDPDCLDLLDRIRGLNERDQIVFQLLQREEEGLTVDDVANRLECERTTAYRSFSRLRDAGIVVQEQLNYDNGGYCYVYRPYVFDAIADADERHRDDLFEGALTLVSRLLIAVLWTFLVADLWTAPTLWTSVTGSATEPLFISEGCRSEPPKRVQQYCEIREIHLALPHQF